MTKIYFLYFAILISSCSTSNNTKIESIKNKMPRVIEKLKNKHSEETIPEELYDFKHFNLKN